MNVLENEFNDYKKYILAQFPNSVLNTDINDYKKEIILIFKSIKFIEILISEESDKNKRDLLNDLYHLYFKLLYILPVNDNYFISLSFRGLSEAILRFYLLQYDSDLPMEKLRRESYRHLWEKVKKTTNYKHLKLSVDQLNTTFGQNSNIIHNKEPSTDIIYFLNQIMCGETRIKKNTLNSTIKQISVATIDSLFLICNFRFDKLSTHNKRMFKIIFSGK